MELQLQRLIRTACQRGLDEDFEIVRKLTMLEDELWQRGRIHRVVLTGGPCGGKSTVMSDLIQMLSDKNFLVFTMPEIATEMFNWSGGRMWDDFAEEGVANDETWAKLQFEMTSVQMRIEDSIVMMARQSLAKRRMLPQPPRGAVILFDRGVVDNVAYCTEEAWSMVQEALGTTTARLRDRRYDYVIHLVTAANGAEKFYTLQQAEGADGTESARHESADQARDMDTKTQKAWLGAKNHHIVSNEGKDFAQKREEVKNIIRRIIGDPVKEERSARLVCEGISRDDMKRFLRADPHVAYTSFSEVRSTLLSDKVRLQKRTMQDRTISYFYQELKEDGTVELQFEMDAWHYQKKLQASQAGHQTAVKDASGFKEEEYSFEKLEDRIITFLYNDIYIRSHFFQPPGNGPMVLVEVECILEDAVKKLPKWLQVKGTAEELCPCMKLLALAWRGSLPLASKICSSQLAQASFCLDHVSQKAIPKQKHRNEVQKVAEQRAYPCRFRALLNLARRPSWS